MNMKTIDGNIFAKPFDESGIIVNKTNSGLKYVGNYDTLIKTEVLADSAWGILEGDIVYVKGTSTKEHWAKTVYEINGVKGIFVPKDNVTLVESDPNSVHAQLPKNYFNSTTNCICNKKY